jgi:hypothetical protein
MPSAPIGIWPRAVREQGSASNTRPGAGRGGNRGPPGGRSLGSVAGPLRSSCTYIRFVALAAAAPALSAFAIACGGGSEPSGPPRIGVADSLTTVRLDRPTPRAGVSSQASLAAAKNEFESFQVVVDAGHALRGVRVTSNKPLRGPGGAVIPARNLTIYREVGY